MKVAPITPESIGHILRSTLKRPMLLAGGIAFFAALLNLAGAIFVIYVFDTVVPTNSLGALGYAALAVTCVYCMQAVLRSWAQGISDTAGTALLDKLEGGFIATQLRSGAHGEGSADEESAELRNLYALARVFKTRSFLVAIEAFCALGFLGFLFAISVYLGLFGLTCLLLLILIAWLASRQKRLSPGRDIAAPGSNLLGRRRGDMPSSAAVDATGYSETVAQRREHERKLQSAAMASENWLHIAGAILKNVMHSGMFATGALLVILEQVEIGELMASGMLMMRIFSPMRALLERLETLRAGWRAYWKLNATSLMADLPEHPADGPHILTVDLPRDAQRRPAVSVSFSLNSGEVALITGPTGSGKSRILATIAGEHLPRGAVIRWDNAAVAAAMRASRTPLCGYAPQEMAFVAGTILETVRRFDQSIDREQVFDICRSLGLHQDIMALEQKYRTPVPPGGKGLPFQLLRRLALARALATRAPLLVLDDPLLGLSPENCQYALSGIQQACARGAIIVIASESSIDALPSGPQITLPGIANSAGKAHIT